MMDRLFVYGTLKRGYRLHYLLDRPDVVFLEPARVRGCLYDLGAYPGWMPCADAGDVEGELYRIAEPGRVFRKLDRVEGFRPDDSGSLFIREMVSVQPGAAADCWAWIYRYNGDLTGAARIHSGRY